MIVCISTLLPVTYPPRSAQISAATLLTGRGNYRERDRVMAERPDGRVSFV